MSLQSVGKKQQLQVFKSFVARISNKLFPNLNCISSQICLTLYCCKIIHNALRSHQYNDTAAHITAGHGQDKLSPLVCAWQNQFLDCLSLLFIKLFKCADYLRPFGRMDLDHVLWFVRRESFQIGERDCQLPSVWTSSVCDLPHKHTLSKDLWKDV